VRSVNVKKNDIHPTAVVHPWARIGLGVKIGPYSVVGEHVAIGDGCTIGEHVLLAGRTTIGKNNTFFHGASVGTAPQDLKYRGELTELVIGDDNTFREFVTLNTATDTTEVTSIGSRCLLMAYAHVAHNCRIGDEVILANAVNLAGHVVIEDYATLGGMTPVHQFVNIGKYAFVGGGSRVERDVPPFIKAAGSPARVYGINSIGLERRGFSAERRARVKDLFKLLYRSELNVSQFLERLGNGYAGDEDAATLLEFLRRSVRGITK
jgi:UDP-N-acetylglucosamine acyltransferase